MSFLITDLETTKGKCGMWRNMPRPSPIKSAALCFFWGGGPLNFCLWVFWLAGAFPYNLKKPQQIPNATATLCSQGGAQRADPGGWSLSAIIQGRRVRRLPFSLHFPALFSLPGTEIFFEYLSFTYLRLSLQCQWLSIASERWLTWQSTRFCSILKHGKLWKLGSTKERGRRASGKYQKEH